MMLLVGAHSLSCVLLFLILFGLSLEPSSSPTTEQQPAIDDDLGDGDTLLAFFPPAADDGDADSNGEQEAAEEVEEEAKEEGGGSGRESGTIGSAADNGTPQHRSNRNAPDALDGRGRWVGRYRSPFSYCRASMYDILVAI